MEEKTTEAPEVAEVLETEEVKPANETETKEVLVTDKIESAEPEKESLIVFVDESGSITKTDVSNNRYFIIALLFTRDSDRLKRYYQYGA